DVRLADRRQQLAEAPHAAAVPRLGRGASQPRVSLDRTRVDRLRVERESEQLAAVRARDRVRIARRRRADAAAERDHDATGRVIAPSEADETSAAYFAKTPLA